MSVMFRRLVYTIVGLAFLLLAGCGGGADAPFVVTGNPANQPSQVVSNESLLGLYNSLSVGYGTRSTAEPVQVFNQDILYNLIGFKTAAPSLFLTNPVRLIDYNFAASNLGIGALTVETSVGNANSRVNVPVYTVPDGGLAVFGVPSALISTPVFSAQMKAVSSTSSELSTSIFYGDWGFVSLSTKGSAVVAQLEFAQTTNSNIGMSTGVGFQSETTKPVSASLLPTRNSNFNLNTTRNKLEFLNSSWFVKAGDYKMALTGQGNGPVADRVSFLTRPFSAFSQNGALQRLSGTYNVVLWTTHSINSASAASSVRLTQVAMSEVITTGTMQFQEGTVHLRNVFGVNSQSLPYEHEPNTKYMWTIPKLRENFTGKIDFKFFISEDQQYIFGLDYDNDQDARTTLAVGVRQSP